MSTGFHPLSIPLPPLQRVGLFAAASVRALADFARLNAAARECVTQMGVRDRALPGALRADIARGADRTAFKCAWECEALADALLPNARQLGIAVGQVELLVAFRDVGNVPASWSLATPLGQWRDVKVTRQGAVEIDLRCKQLTGHVDLTALPATLAKLNLYANRLTGAIDLTQLPASLTELWLYGNQLTGPIDLTKLPASLTRLDLGINKLTGAVDLTQLPAALTELDLHYNAGLTGPIDLTKLPASLTRLWLFQNQLTGSVDLTRLPALLSQLRLERNQLTGTVDLTKLPATLTTLRLEHNAGLTGVWRGSKPRDYEFDGTGITVGGAGITEAGACVIA
jgi:hypothetical protein